MNLFGCSIFTSISKEHNQIAITFDDGPHANNTEHILTLLRKHNAKATFFNTGKNLRANRSIAEEVVSEGHSLGNHTYSHPNAILSNAKELRRELITTKELIEDITHKPNLFFRPPYGIFTPSLLSICRTLGLSMVLWNANTFDFRRKAPEVMIKRVANKLAPGTIVLFHECHHADEQLDYSNTTRALEVILCEIDAKNIKALSLDAAIFK